MEYFLFAGYLVLFAWLVTRIPFFTKSGLTPAQLIIIFLLKVMAGIFYGWIGVYYGELAQMVDTWAYHYESIKSYEILLTNPSNFFPSLFHNPYEQGFTRFLSSNDSWWNDLKGNFLLMILSFFNLASFGHYYINVIFYSFISFFGPIAIYRVMQDVFPAKKAAVLIASFLVPSFIYWTSGIHKEGLIFIGLALVVYHIYFSLKEKRFSLPRVLLILFGFTLVLALRNFLIITLVPALVAWLLAERLRYKPVWIFSSAYLLFITLFFTARYIHPALDFPEAVVVKRGEFLQLLGTTSIDLPRLEPNLSSFLVNAPQAFSLAAIRPYPADVHHLLSLAAAIEINVLLLLFVVFLILRRRDHTARPFLWFGVALSLSILFMIGYSVNNLGAIVRYRSIVLPFLIVPIIALTDWSRVSSFILGDIRSKNNI
ncbi:MAG TPA: hypothetical protein VGE66_06845 [Chitinophagaceae bacterium]